MVTLQFQRSPFHPIKRTVLVPWNEIVVIQTPIVMAAGADSEHSYSLTGSDSPASDSFSSSILGSHPDPVLRIGGGGNPSSVRSFNASSGVAFLCPDHNYERMKGKIVEPHPSETSQSLGGTIATQESAGIGESQTLQETISIPGSSGVKLLYKSSSAPGFLSTITLQLTGGKIPPTLRVIHLRVVVEGNLFSKLLEPDPFLRYTYSWNKRNVYRQKVYGLTTARGKKK